MPLPSGTRLGAYEILAPLGAGGMGEVYRARDLKLGREVAIKVLPAERSADPERRRRFEQEARSASALNHPNILTIHEIGAAGETVYIAMELVDGRTVRELIADGPCPIRKLLDIAAHVAEGLTKAHGAGIVHRDLKPENLMISKDGYVKILDFGLAKLAEPLSQEVSAMPTAVGSATEPGTVMGTIGYMSPEQAAGRSLDFRSDQFAFGSILYEMATGKRAFQRKTSAETLVAIMREEPEPIVQSNPRTPAPLRWVVERCLAKDPEDRYASTRDLARDLATVRDHLSETTSADASAGVEPARSRRYRWLLPAASALVAGLVLGLYLESGVVSRKLNSPIVFQRLTYQRGTILSARFAPDGQTIVYGAAWEGRPLDLFSTRPDSTESRPLGLPSADIFSISSAGEMAISLDRHFILGFETAGTLARVPLGGGTPRPILENVQDADWSPDGKTLAVARHIGNRNRLEYPIGTTIYDTAGWVSNVRVSPDGKLVAFIDHPQRGDNDGVVKVLDAAGKVRLTGPYANTGLAWSPRGDEVWSSFPITATSLSGKTRVAWASPGWAILHDIARDGRLLFSLASPRREIVGLSSGENRERNLTWLDYSFPSSISRDGKTLLFDEQNLRPAAVYRRGLDGSPAVRLGEGKSFALSPDGRWALITRQPEYSGLTLLPVGPGEPRALPAGDLTIQWANFFPDGRRILISGNEPGHGIRFFVQDLSGGKPRAITPEGVNLTASNGISPDGKSIAAIGPDRRVAIYPVEPGEPRIVPGLTPEDVTVQWTPDGRSLYVSRLSAPPVRVDLVDVETGRRTLWKEFRPPDPAGVAQVGPMVITPDGSSYVYSYRRVLDELYLATGIR